MTPPSTTPTFLPDNQQVLVNENGVHINMFGSSEQNENLTIAIPLWKVKLKKMIGRIPKKSFATPTSQASSIPVPLFPENSQIPLKPALLPTPPPHIKLTPEDFQKMENMPHEYWEAPELSRPHPPEPPRPHPPSGPQWRPPVEQSYRAQPPCPPRQRQPFYRPPIPPRQPLPPEHRHQSWSPPQQWPVTNTVESLVPSEMNRTQNQGNWNQNISPRSGPNTGGHYPRSGIDPRSSEMDPRSSRMDPRQGGMNPRQVNNDPRHSMSDPRALVHNDSRSPPQSYHGQHTKWGQSANMEQRQIQSSPSYTGQHGMSPPNYGKPGWSEKISPNWKTEHVSPVWGSSPDHTSSVKTGDDAVKRVDPRKKYSHLKIKSKNSPSQSSNKDSTVTTNSDSISSGPGFKIPKLLTNSTSLDKPIDPKELFGNDGVDTQPYGEITFGTYKSPFNQSSDLPKSSDSETTSNNHSTIPSDSQNNESKSSVAGGQEVAVPSYFAQIDSELGGGGLEIESAFGSLSEKSKESQPQESQARKLPSVFGFGL